MTTDPPRLKRSVIKEELVTLIKEHAPDVVKPHIGALILNQFLYWTERVRDFDAFIVEEKARNAGLDLEPSAGWIYKNAEELVDELMIDVSAVTIRREIARIIAAGYIEERHNPKYKWDRTIQYRVNLVKIQHDLQWLGFSLEGYPLLGDPEATFKMKVQSNTVKVGGSKTKVRVRTFEAAIPETTTEITTDIIGDSAPATPEAATTDNQNSDSRQSTGTRLTLTDLPADWRAFCQQQRPDLDPTLVWEMFRDFWTSKPGKDGRKTNWLATWRNWVRNQHAITKPNGKPMKSSAEQVAVNRQQVAWLEWYKRRVDPSSDDFETINRVQRAGYFRREQYEYFRAKEMPA